MAELVLVSNSLGALLFIVLGVVLGANWRGGPVGFALGLACLASVILFTAQAGYRLDWAGLRLWHLYLLEVLRDGAWFAVILSILRVARVANSPVRRFAVYAVPSLLLLLQGAMVGIPGVRAVAIAWLGPGSAPVFLGFLLLAITGLVLVEVLFRNTRPDQRWAVKLLYFGIGGMFAYDVYLYAHAVLFKGIMADIWDARGLVNAMTVPLIAISVVRNPQWRADLFVSRQVLFHSTAVMLIGFYLLLMAAAGYLIREYGGSWGSALQTAFLFGAALVLMVVALSSQVRARVRVFLAKHFYRNKYDYREEWLNFTGALSARDGDQRAIEQTILKAIAGLLDCRWGYLWLQDASGGYQPTAECNLGSIPDDMDEPGDSDLIVFLRDRNWVIDLDEYAEHPELYEGLDELPAWLRRMNNAWLLVPLPHGDRLLGFLLLSRSLVNHQLGWEDRDLLKTAALQAGAYIALLRATDELAEARQFDAYNRLSAYIVHDLKNVTAQLALLVSNAERHRDNPEFIDDAFKTVSSAVDRMNRMLVNLRSGKAADERARPIVLADLLQDACARRKLAEPAPCVQVEDGDDLTAVAEPTRLAKALEHLITNAQEATSGDGRVVVRLSRQGDNAIIQVQDTGVGMDAGFIRNQLFKPFHTTKGNAGMGIGVYETRQIIQESGGELLVDSEIGKGTTFTIRLPLHPVAPVLQAASGDAIT